jgi:hypothetical protein
MVRWVIGLETAFNMGMAVLFSFSIASTLGAFGFFVFQVYYMKIPFKDISTLR